MLCCFDGSKEIHPDVPKWERDIPGGWKVLALKLRSLGVSPSQKFKQVAKDVHSHKPERRAVVPGKGSSYA